ncbi:hypothetical protein ACIP98_21115 [Streptomyces sp. NPDC088354]|uniref:hypothetical protein n=1 Tax=Streptomyces sp. NPDC088354 TaxID=3365856 RepID=UPI00380CE26E
MTAQQRGTTPAIADARATTAQLLDRAAADYAAARHPDTRRAWVEQGVQARASLDAAPDSPAKAALLAALSGG